MQVQLVSTNGTTTLSGTTGLTFSAGDGSADATMTFTGTIANINAALAGLSFNPTSNFTGAASLKIVTSDQGYTGTGGTLTDTDTVAITVAYAPVVSATGTLAYTENGTPQLASAMTVTDTDSPNLVSATVTMTAGYVAGQDTLAVVNPNGITWTWTPATGVLALSGTATVANYQAALRSITYNNNSDAPNTTARTVTFVVNDGVLDSNTSSRTITIAAVNDVPVVTTTSGSMAYTENATTLLDPGITVTDVDNANLSSVTVDMTTNFVTAQDTLAFVNQNGITADLDPVQRNPRLVRHVIGRQLPSGAAFDHVQQQQPHPDHDHANRHVRGQRRDWQQRHREPNDHSHRGQRRPRQQRSR